MKRSSIRNSILPDEDYFETKRHRLAVLSGNAIEVTTHPAWADHALAAATAGVARASRMAVRALRPLRRPVSTMEQRAA
jgi:hypothetical protein